MNLIRAHKKLLLFLLLALIGLSVLVFFVLYKVGDLRPAILPPKEDLVETIEKQNTGAAVDFPLILSEGLQIGVFAKNISKARDLQFTPEGTLLVSSPETGKVFALVDDNNDGVAEQTKEIIIGLNRPHGLSFHKSKLFVAELQKVHRYNWEEKSSKATLEKTLFSLPYSNGHVTRTLEITSSGTLYVSVGSTCNVCFEEHELLAAVAVSDIEGNNLRLFAKGLRNSVFIKLHPETGELWGTENSRDLLGDNVPPDELNIIRDGRSYGWPICYGNRFHDRSFDPKGEHESHCAETVPPIFETQAHSAPLGLNFINSGQFPEDWQGDLLVSYHGSWNRSEPTGYKVVRLKVEGNKITKQEDFLTGFLQGSNALGRPVDLEFDKAGSLFISDDKANAVYKIVKK
jgi:glucose/arabinose dehydrogenase